MFQEINLTRGSDKADVSGSLWAKYLRWDSVAFAITVGMLVLMFVSEAQTFRNVALNRKCLNRLTSISNAISAADRGNDELLSFIAEIQKSEHLSQSGRTFWELELWSGLSHKHEEDPLSIRPEHIILIQKYCNMSEQDAQRMAIADTFAHPNGTTIDVVFVPCLVKDARNWSTERSSNPFGSMNQAPLIVLFPLIRNEFDADALSQVDSDALSSLQNGVVDFALVEQAARLAQMRGIFSVLGNGERRIISYEQ